MAPEKCAVQRERKEEKRLAVEGEKQILRAYTVRDLLLLSSDYLKERSVPHARREAEWLISEVLEAGDARLDVYLRFDDEVDDVKKERLREMLRRRGKREPLAYIVGRVDFMGTCFKVTPDVLIPRPETEVLAETALSRFPADAALRIADVGTGCGVLSGTLLKEYKDARALATDISKKALLIAEENLTNLGVMDRVELKACDLLPETLEPFDLVAANLPYVSSVEYEKLEPEVKAEPREALVPGERGTELITALVRLAPEILKPGGWLLLEIGYNQSEEVEKMMREARLEKILVEEDLAGLPRVVGGRLPR